MPPGQQLGSFCCCRSTNAKRFEPEHPISASLYPDRLVSLRLEPQSQLVLIHAYSQNRFSNSLNSFGLISSLLIPSISINTPWRA